MPKKKEYTFPFDTCEIPKKNGIAQPFSMLFNLLTSIMIFFFLIKAKSIQSFILLLTILSFELFHTFSHSFHLNGNIQINVTHTMTYLINIAFFLLFYKQTHIFPSFSFLFYILLLVIIDIYSVFNLSIVYYLLSQSLIFISILLYYYQYLPGFIQKSIYKISALVILIILLFLNEKYNCKRMLSVYPKFPYHIFIEITGFVLFFIICSNFYKL